MMHVVTSSEPRMFIFSGKRNTENKFNYHVLVQFYRRSRRVENGKNCNRGFYCWKLFIRPPLFCDKNRTPAHPRRNDGIYFFGKNEFLNCRFLHFSRKKKRTILKNIDGNKMFYIELPTKTILTKIFGLWNSENSGSDFLSSFPGRTQDNSTWSKPSYYQLTPILVPLPTLILKDRTNPEMNRVRG